MASTTLSRMAPHWSALGLRRKQNIHYQLSPEELVEQSLCRSQGQLTDSGALLIQTGEFTGRSPRDKFIVRDPLTADSIHWNEFNQPLDPDHFEVILSRMRSYLDRQPEVWLRDCLACADPRYRLRIRVINDRPWSNLFAYNMFLRPTAEELEDFIPDWTVWHAAGLRLDPEACGIRQGNAAVISLRHRMILIAGTGYTGEIKKGVFTILNYLLPRHHQVLPMHCSANLGTEGDTALFFGLSGTGKTTLSADPCRRLIGDDEHGWSEDRIFNFEGGCYAKTIQLSPEKEPAIFQAIRPGALLENACFFPGTHRIDFHDASRTE
ncbi:MAG TPA: phosphoenolpyruvate carboxykinase (ATP), partial [Chitinophagaceae bacterium]|nr:phosphoenolpyruvate carboxykinase (ATP) [Chitinophagaceae bacterium]